MTWVTEYFEEDFLTQPDAVPAAQPAAAASAAESSSLMGTGNASVARRLSHLPPAAASAVPARIAGTANNTCPTKRACRCKAGEASCCCSVDPNDSDTEVMQARDSLGALGRIADLLTDGTTAAFTALRRMSGSSLARRPGRLTDDELPPLKPMPRSKSRLSETLGDLLAGRGVPGMVGAVLMLALTHADRSLPELCRCRGHQHAAAGSRRAAQCPELRQRAAARSRDPAATPHCRSIFAAAVGENRARPVLA